MTVKTEDWRFQKVKALLGAKAEAIPDQIIKEALHKHPTSTDLAAELIEFYWRGRQKCAAQAITECQA